MKKKIVGLVLLATGIVCLIYGAHQMYQISQAKKAFRNMSIPFSDKKVGVITGQSLAEAEGQKDQETMWLLLSGVASTIVGGGLIFLGKKRKR